MAELLFNFRKMDLDIFSGNIGDVKNIISDALFSIGFIDTVNTASEVAGIRNGVRISILHLRKGPKFSLDDPDPRYFWQVFMAVGDEPLLTQETLDEVVNRIELIS